MTRIVAFSDLHHHEDLAEAILKASTTADLVIGAGDFCNMRHGLAEVMDWFKPIAPKSVFVAGNAESADELRAVTEACVLHGEMATLAGLTIFGLGYAVPVTPFGTWSCDLTEHAAAQLLSPLQAVDILVTHSPPKGLADQTSRGISVGSTAIRDAITLRQPRLALCGHIHDSWGVRGQIGRTEVVNLGPRPVTFDL
jgi:uncharacterized protein